MCQIHQRAVIPNNDCLMVAQKCQAAARRDSTDEVMYGLLTLQPLSLLLTSHRAVSSSRHDIGATLATRFGDCPVTQWCNMGTIIHTEITLHNGSMTS